MDKFIRVKDFIRELCNDHNGEIRWLRGVAIDNKHLLDQILSLPTVQAITLDELTKIYEGMKKVEERDEDDVPQGFLYDDLTLTAFLLKIREAIGEKQ